MTPTSPGEWATLADLCKKDLYLYSRVMFKARRRYRWLHNWHHEVICRALERVYEGKTRRLIINVPPRYSKTELVVVNFITWALAKNPDAEFIYTSYSGRLASNYSWQARETLTHEDYRAMFPGTRLASDSKARDEWRTTAGGIVYATGSLGTITGYGAGKERDEFGGAILIDDPHKADEAKSDVMREKVIDWFQTTLESRKNSPERTPIILIMQRLHERDLAGWLLDGGNGEEWEHVCLPAIQPDGSALWPAKHTIERLRAMERAAPYVFAGQYQQRPSPLGGGTFKSSMIEVIDAIPAGVIRWVRAWDLAGTTDGDYTAGVKMGLLPDGRVVIAHVVRDRTTPDTRDQMLVATASADGKGVRISIPQDPGQAGISQVRHLTRRLAGYSVTASPESGDKETRADPFASQVNVGNVLMVRGAWNDPLTAEMDTFPRGAYDDQIDACSRAYNELTGGSTGLIELMQQQADERRAMQAAAAEQAAALAAMNR